MNQFTAMIIDDEPLAHEIIMDYVSELQNITVVKQCYSATEAMQYLSSHSIDILFLDINMPKLSGIEMLKILNKKPQTIITSAYRQYALEGFELNVCDYLLKPIRSERFYQAINKAITALSHGQNVPTYPNSSAADTSLFIKVDRSHVAVKLTDISYCEAYGNYVKVWTKESMYLTPSTFSRIEQQLLELSASFIRIHKSYLVNAEYIHKLQGNELTLTYEVVLPVGRVHKKALRDFINTSAKA